jgi:hypothetical protein
MKFAYVFRISLCFLIALLTACGSDDTTIIIRSDFPANDGQGSGSGASVTYVNKSDGSIHETTDIEQFLKETPQN